MNMIIPNCGGFRGDVLPREVWEIPRLCLMKYAPIHRRGELKFFSGGVGGGVEIGFEKFGDTLYCVKKSGGDVFSFKLTAMLECGYSLAAAGLLTVLFSMWNAAETPTYLPAKDGGYGYLDFEPDDCKAYFGGLKWSRVRKVCGELSKVIRLEKLKKGRWRAVFLLERCDRMLYDGLEEDARRYGSVVKYLELHESDVIKKAMQFFESERNAKREKKDDVGCEKSGDSDLFIDGL